MAPIPVFSAAESNKRYRYLLSKANRDLSVAFDLPTQIGMDSDALFSARAKLARSAWPSIMEDMELLFDQIRSKRFPLR